MREGPKVAQDWRYNFSLAFVREGFTRRQRLLKPDSYRRVFSENIRSIDKSFTVLARANGLGYARLGMAISKKHTRKAVERNRLKRLIRESFRLNQAFLSGLDVVVLNRRETDSFDNQQCLSSLTNHWHKMAKKCNASSSS